MFKFLKKLFSAQNTIAPNEMKVPTVEPIQPTINQPPVTKSKTKVKTTVKPKQPAKPKQTPKITSTKAKKK